MAWEICTSIAPIPIHKFLFRAWNKKEKHPLYGIPDYMTIPKNVQLYFPDLINFIVQYDWACDGNIKLPENLNQDFLELDKYSVIVWMFLFDILHVAHIQFQRNSRAHSSHSIAAISIFPLFSYANAIFSLSFIQKSVLVLNH